jgi:hypothetical protein
MCAAQDENAVVYPAPILFQGFLIVYSFSGLMKQTN